MTSLRGRLRDLDTHTGVRRVGFLLVGVWLLSAFGNAVLIAPASVFPVIMEDLSIGPTRAGWIVSMMLGGQALTSIVAGMTLDRRSNRHVVAFGTFAFLGTCLWAWQAVSTGSYWSLLAARAAAGFSLMFIWNGGINMIGRAVSTQYKATAIGIFAASGPGGFAIGQLAGPVIADAIGWASIFPVFGALCAVGLLVFWPASRTHERERAQTATPQFADFRRVFTTANVWFVSILGFMAFTLYSFINSWMPSYLADSHGLSLAQSGLLVALFPAVGVVSRSGGGILSDVLFDGRRRPVALLTFVVSAPFLAVIFLAPTTAILVVALVAVGFFVQLGMGLFLTYIRELAHDNVSATAVAFLTAVGVFGAFTAPIIGGLLLEATGSFTAAFGYAGIVALAGCAMAWFAPEPRR